jgi:hypothetical protein
MTGVKAIRQFRRYCQDPLGDPHTLSLTRGGRVLEFLRCSAGSAQPPQALPPTGPRSRRCTQRTEQIAPANSMQVGWALHSRGSDTAQSRLRKISVVSGSGSMLSGGPASKRVWISRACRRGPVETEHWPRAPEFGRVCPGV